MIAGHAWLQPTRQAGIRYRYYVSKQCLNGEAKTAADGSVSRSRPIDIEDIIGKILEAASEAPIKETRQSYWRALER